MQTKSEDKTQQEQEQASAIIHLIVEEFPECMQDHLMYIFNKNRDVSSATCSYLLYPYHLKKSKYMDLHSFSISFEMF